MPSNAEKLFERAQHKKTNWHVEELETLYYGYGFRIENSKHRKIYHPDYPQLVSGGIPHHGKVHQYMVGQAVKLIKKLKELQELEVKDDNDGNESEGDG